MLYAHQQELVEKVIEFVKCDDLETKLKPAEKLKKLRTFTAH